MSSPQSDDARSTAPPSSTDRGHEHLPRRRTSVTDNQNRPRLPAELLLKVARHAVVQDNGGDFLAAVKSLRHSSRLLKVGAEDAASEVPIVVQNNNQKPTHFVTNDFTIIPRLATLRKTKQAGGPHRGTVGAIAIAPKMQSLSIKSFSDADLEALPNTLRELNLTCSRSSEAAVRNLVAKLTELRHLSFGDMRVSDALALDLARNPALQYLSFCGNVTPGNANIFMHGISTEAQAKIEAIFARSPGRTLVI
jgi:hypothetical protein